VHQQKYASKLERSNWTILKDSPACSPVTGQRHTGKTYGRPLRIQLVCKVSIQGSFSMLQGVEIIAWRFN